TGKYHLFSEILFQDLPEKIKENTWTMENLAVGMDEKQISYLWKDAAYLGDPAKPSAKTVCSLDDDRLIAASYLVTHKEDGSIYSVFVYEKEKVVSILIFDQENKLIKHDGKEIQLIDKSVFSDTKGKNFALLKNELDKNSCFKELSVKDADGVKAKLYYYFGQSGNIYEITVKNNMIEKVMVFPMLTVAL
ncbi:MAG: hypothetical protein J6D00_02365, partial [Christensenellaceae bacterium]|nr:hypothetical protein [Christensenellaceae bacterium]